MITDEQLIAFLEGSLSDDEQRVIEQALSKDEDLRRRQAEFQTMLASIENSVQFESPSEVKEAFLSELHAEMASSQGTAIRWQQLAAAVVLMAVGFFLGLFARPDGDDQLAAEVKVLQEALLTNQLVEHSASTRLQVVNAIERLEVQPSSEMLEVLVGTVNTDKSANVRYKAVQALSRFLHMEYVRSELVRSLEKQQDALIQLAIIELLVQAEEKAAIAPLKRLRDGDQVAPEVKKQAAVAVEILI